MAQAELISSDSHVIEPRNLWVDRIDSAFKDKAPRWVMDPPGLQGEYFVVEGKPPSRPVVTFSAGVPAKDLPKHSATANVDDCRPGAWDPAERMKDMELDGVSAEVIYSTKGLFLLGLADAPYQRACFDAFNGWLSEFCSYAPKKLLGQALISVINIQDAVHDLKHAAKLGLRGAMIPCSLPDYGSYSDEKYDPFWAAAEELGVPVTLHVATGHPAEAHYDPWVRGLLNHIDVQRSLTDIIFNGVFDKFPNLKIVSSENDIGWVAHYVYRADAYYERMKYLRNGILKLLPTDYFRKNVHVTFMDDVIGVRNADFFGADTFSWSSDFPHIQSTWPNSRDFVEKNFEGISDDIRRKITRDNVLKLYNLSLD